MRKYNYVYITTNLINKNFYIGKHSTDKLNDSYLGSGKRLSAAIKKYGKENFKKRILCFCESEEQAFEVEKFLVTDYLVNREDCYNMHIGGDGGKMNDETNKKHSIYMKEYYKTHNVWHKGKKNVYSKDTIKRMSNAQKGKVLSEEHKKKLSEAHTGKPLPKNKWITPDGNIIEMAKNNVMRFHKDWVLIE